MRIDRSKLKDNIGVSCCILLQSTHQKQKKKQLKRIFGMISLRLKWFSNSCVHNLWQKKTFDRRTRSFRPLHACILIKCNSEVRRRRLYRAAILPVMCSQISQLRRRSVLTCDRRLLEIRQRLTFEGNQLKRLWVEADFKVTKGLESIRVTVVLY